MYIKIPQILNGGENSVSLNQKMIGDIYQKSYCIPQNSNDYNSIEEYQQQARQVLRATYEYKILNNVVAIVTKLDREGINNQALSASYSFNYFYDLKNNTELEMCQALPLMGYTVADIKRLGANSFDDFKVLEGFKGEEPFRTYIEIQNNKIVITYKEEGAY